MLYPKILIVATSHVEMGEKGEERDGGRPTGVWFEELTTPYYRFADAGLDVTIATIEGGNIPVDPNSLKDENEEIASVQRIQKDKAAMEQIENSKRLDTLSIEDYAAIFLPGGHGAMWDFPESPLLGDMISGMWAEGKIVSAVCHGPAGLVNAVDTTGRPLVAGRTVTAFTDSEEAASGLTLTVPFLLETRLRELGANFIAGPDFQPHAERDGNLITGQNPQSSGLVASLVLEGLGKR